jgi:hypothetical protein
MAISIIKCVNTSIRVTPTLSVPTIKVVIDYGNGATPNDFCSQIMSLSTGFVVAGAMWSDLQKPEPASWWDLPSGNSVYGDDNGFRLNVTRFRNDYTTGVYQIYYYFKGSFLGYTETYLGGYGRTVSPILLIVDSDNNLFVGGQFWPCVQQFTQLGTAAGISTIGNALPIMTVVEGVVRGQKFSVGGRLSGGNITDFIDGEVDPTITDPYTSGGESEPGGGTGDFDGTSVPVDFASLPTLSAVDAGLITLFNPTGAQLKSLGAYLWSDLFSLDTLKKLFSDPMEAILGLSIIPGPVPQGSLTTVKFGNIDTGIYMTPASAQYFDVDCGSLNVEEYWGAYLDYEPYTKAEIYLPFIGVHQISVDDIMGKTVAIRYHIDILSGGCACEIKCGDSVLYTFVGCCASSVPVTGRDWTNLINGVISCGVAVGSLVATGGATAPAVAGEIASAVTNGLKPTTEKSGSLSGAGGMLAGKKPVLMLTRPRQALPGNQNKYTGYPSFMTKSLGALSGYTEIHSILLSGIDGTESEIAEIEELLKGGVIL